MSVPSLPFLAFAAVAALLINCSPQPAWRRGVMFVANLAFFLSFAHDVHRIAPFVLLLALGFGFVKLFEARKSGGTFAAAIVMLLAVFCWLKHYSFVPQQLFLHFSYLTVGMSYVFFRILSLVIDGYQGSYERPIGAVSYLNYTLNFTCLVSGPIQLYSEYRRSEDGPPAPLDAAIAWHAFERIIIGFFKVSILSPLLEHAQDLVVAGVAPALDPVARIGHAFALIVIFPIFLYTNFSGYCDVVIGVARFLRLELPENFNHPFASKGFIEFWGRWHITLSNWLKVYVYSPLFLTLMRRFPSRAAEPWLGVFSYFVTFFIIGLWHGQTAAFAFFGGLLGLGVSANKAYQLLMMKRLGRNGYRALCGHPVYASFSRALTFFWFGFSMLWFWSSWTDIARFATTLGFVPAAIGCLAVIVLAAPVLSAIEACGARLARFRFLDDPVPASPYLRTARAASLFVLVASVEVLMRAPAPHIVYRGF